MTTARTAVRWTVDVRRDDGALDAVSADWDDLYGRCLRATPFQSGDWLRSWWRAYGRPGRLRLVMVRRDGLLVAGAALMLQGRWPNATLGPVGAGQSDVTDPLVADECSAEATRELITALLAEPGWALIRLPESRPGGAARQTFDAWPGRRRSGPASTCLEIPVAPLPEVLSRVPGRTAGTLRKKFRKIDAAGFTVTRVPPEQAEDGIRALLALHRRQWAGREVNSEHLSARFAQHLAGAVAGLARRGQAVIVQYRQQDRLVASEVLLVGHTFVGAYLFGFDPALREQIDVAAMLVRQNLEQARQLERPVLSLLRGDEPYKMRWRPDRMHNEELVLARPGSPAGVGYLLYRHCRARAMDVARRRLPRLLGVLQARKISRAAPSG